MARSFPAVLLVLLTACALGQSRVTLHELRLVDGTWLDLEAGSLLSRPTVGPFTGDFAIFYDRGWSFQGNGGAALLPVESFAPTPPDSGWVESWGVQAAQTWPEEWPHPAPVWLRAADGRLARAELFAGFLTLTVQHEPGAGFPAPVSGLRARYGDGRFTLSWAEDALAEVSVAVAGTGAYSSLGRDRGRFVWEAPADGTDWSFEVNRIGAGGGAAVPARIGRRAATGLRFERIVWKPGGSGGFQPFSFGDPDEPDADTPTVYVSLDRVDRALTRPGVAGWHGQGLWEDFFGGAVGAPHAPLEDYTVHAPRGGWLGLTDAEGRAAKLLLVGDEHVLRASTGDRGPAPDGPDALRLTVEDGLLRLSWDPVPGAVGYCVYRLDPLGELPLVIAEPSATARTVPIPPGVFSVGVSALFADGRESWPRAARCWRDTDPLPRGARWTRSEHTLTSGARLGPIRLEHDGTGRPRIALDTLWASAWPMTELPDSLHELATRTGVRALLHLPREKPWNPRTGARIWLRVPEGIALVECLGRAPDAVRLRFYATRIEASEKLALMRPPPLPTDPELAAELAEDWRADEGSVALVYDWGPLALWELPGLGASPALLETLAEAVWEDWGWWTEDYTLAFPAAAPGRLEPVVLRVRGSPPGLAEQIELIPHRVGDEVRFAVAPSTRPGIDAGDARNPLEVAERLFNALDVEHPPRGDFGFSAEPMFSRRCAVVSDPDRPGAFVLEGLVAVDGEAAGPLRISFDPALPGLSFARLDARWVFEGREHFVEIVREAEGGR